MTLAIAVMKKVRTIFIVRKLFVPFVIFAAAIVIVISTVSVGNVLQNMPHVFDIEASVKFLVAAFAHTDTLIKSALVAGLAFGLFTLKGLIETRRISLLGKA